MESNVIFSKINNSDDNNDVWDDTALIRAYDKAVNKIKSDLTNKKSDTATNLDKKEKKKSHKKESKSSNNSKKSERKENKKAEKVRSSKWKVGDHCAAIYTEDGKLYPGVIIDINYDDEKCRVRYDYYENEEDKLLSELYESSEFNENEEDEDVESTTEAAFTPKVKKSSKKQEAMFTTSFNFPIPPPPPPLPASLVSHFDNLKLDENFTNAGVDDKEAFYSMLMSWYMSGYHTGYYFGLTQRQSQNN